MAHRIQVSVAAASIQLGNYAHVNLSLSIRRALDENFTGTLPDKLFLDVLMKVNFSLPKTQLMQIAASCTDGHVGGGRSFAPGSTHVNYNLFLRRVEAVLKVMTSCALFRRQTQYKTVTRPPSGKST